MIMFISYVPIGMQENLGQYSEKTVENTVFASSDDLYFNFN